MPLHIGGKMLTPEQRLARQGAFNASFAPKLMSGDEQAILNEWKGCVGDPGYIEEDLSESWPVQLGSFLEPLVLDWHERKTGHALTRRGERVVHPERPWCGATLDAYRAHDNWVLDAKVVGRWRKIDEVCAYYAPQILVQRDCVTAAGGSLLVVLGSDEPVEYPIHLPDDYCARVWERIDWFWNCVESLAPPYEVAPIVAPPAPVVEYDMQTNNSWADQALHWQSNKINAKWFKDAEAELKKLVPADAKRCYGHGIEIVRSKAGSLTIKELK